MRRGVAGSGRRALVAVVAAAFLALVVIPIVRLVVLVVDEGGSDLGRVVTSAGLASAVRNTLVLAVLAVAYPARRRGAGRSEARQEALDVLRRLGIGHLAARRPAELSGGERQRVGLGRALARQSSLYLFGEPTAHLDTHVRAVFLDELVRRRRESGAAALYATHDAEEALGLADRVLLLSAGRVVQVGTPEQVYAEPVDLWTARLTGPASVLVGEDAAHRLVRPESATLGGDREGTVRSVSFRGPPSDYLVETAEGALLLREPGRRVRLRDNGSRGPCTGRGWVAAFDRGECACDTKCARLVRRDVDGYESAGPLSFAGGFGVGVGAYRVDLRSAVASSLTPTCGPPGPHLARVLLWIPRVWLSTGSLGRPTIHSCYDCLFSRTRVR